MWKGGKKSRIDHLSRLLLDENSEPNFDRSSFEDKSTDLMIDRQISEGIDSFEELFQAMSLMKNQASTLQGADRKAYAEKMTMAFWQAIEGSPEEIQGLDSSEDEDWKLTKNLFFFGWEMKGERICIVLLVSPSPTQFLKSRSKTSVMSNTKASLVCLYFVLTFSYPSINNYSSAIVVKYLKVAVNIFQAAEAMIFLLIAIK